MAANFVVQILIVRYLSKSDYGAFAYAWSLVDLGSSLTVFGFDKTITRFLPTYQEKGEYQKVFGSIIMMVSTVFSLSFFLILLVFGLRGWISASFISDQLAFRLLLLLIFLVPIQALDEPPGWDACRFFETKFDFFSKVCSWTEPETFSCSLADLPPKQCVFLVNRLYSYRSFRNYHLLWNSDT